jgi:signal transduction histidine kinase
MHSLRTRVFVTVAVVLAAATAAAGLLSRRATLVEERQILGPRRMPALDGLEQALQSSYAIGGWDRARETMLAEAARRDLRLLAVDGANRSVAASSPDLEAARVRTAGADGHLSLETERDGARSNIEVRGVPTFTVRDAEGGTAGRVFVMPRGEPGELGPADPMIPGWVAATVGTALVALLLAFALSGRILRPIGELTAAARRMREGDLDVRVVPRGDDEIARLAHAFNGMAERLAQTERAKRQLVGDVAHELRSPVTNLRCGLEAIQDGLVAPDRARVDALHSETLLLQRLIGDLQDLALADAGGLLLEREPVDVGAAIQRALGADVGGGARVTVSVDDAARVLADAGRLEQMLRNLISNAKRHTPPDGAIEIRARRDGGVVRIAVRDTGCGIAPEHLPHVFERFYRADPSRDRATGGAGLGLAIVRRLAEAHGGSATAHSDGEGRGSTFTVELAGHR